jgi:NitT/TauT family transport system permease protein
MKRRSRRARRREPIIIGTVAVILFLLAWQAVCELHWVSSLFLPSPIDIARAEVDYLRSPTFGADIEASGEELIYGYLLAIVVGLPLGLLMGWYRRLTYALDPFVSLLYSTPRIALTPLLIIWLGIGIYSKVAVVFLGAVFPIIINSAAGVRSLDPALVKASRSFGANDWQLFRTLALPGSLPFIIAGMRLGVGHALIGVVVGELVAAQHGVGQAMTTFGTTFQTASVFATMLLIAVAGLILQILFQRLENKFEAWRPQ